MDHPSIKLMRICIHASAGSHFGRMYIFHLITDPVEWCVHVPMRRLFHIMAPEKTPNRRGGVSLSFKFGFELYVETGRQVQFDYEF